MVNNRVNVSFRTLPKTPPLFVDYLERGVLSQPFFPRHFSQPEAYQEVARALRLEPAHRNALAHALRQQNERWGMSEKTRANIQALREADCFALLTGQQVGLLTGPCYTIYKALSAIKLAHTLTQRGLQTVPVFWMETYDHDLDEINHLVLLDEHSQSLLNLHYPFDERDVGHSVGGIPLNAEMAAFQQSVCALFPENSEFFDETRKLIEHCYRPGGTVGDAFAQMMSQLLGRYGLILFDPADRAVAALSSPLFNWALHQCDSLANELAHANEKIVQAGFQPQIKLEPKSTFIFYSEDGVRRLLLCEGCQVRHKGTEQRWSVEEAQKRVESEPEKFSASVALRPLLQDHLFPTIGYVGGPSEISYFAQLHGLYERKERPMPVIVPRSSFTLITKKVERIISKYSLSVHSAFEPEEQLLGRVFERYVSGDVAAQFERLRNLMNEELDRIKLRLAQTDETIAHALETARNKMQYQVNHLKTRYLHAEERRHAVVTQHLQAFQNLLYPHKNLQERELNICYFLARYGKGILHSIYQAIEPDEHDHKVLTLDF